MNVAIDFGFVAARADGNVTIKIPIEVFGDGSFQARFDTSLERLAEVHLPSCYLYLHGTLRLWVPSITPKILDYEASPP